MAWGQVGELDSVNFTFVIQVVEILPILSGGV